MTSVSTADGEMATQAVRTVVATRTLLEGAPFRDKPTTTTPGQQERSATAWAAAGEQARTGLWECGIGTFTAVRDGEHEICYIVSGRASLHDATGSVTEIVPGTVLALPAGWKGTWEVHEPVEKMFVLIRE
jgi:uncharacterized protein